MSDNKERLFELSSYIFLISLIIVGLIIIIAGRVDGNNGKNYISQNLEHAEIREYEGENLSSINDFRENSISGMPSINHEAKI